MPGEAPPFPAAVLIGFYRFPVSFDLAPDEDGVRRTSGVFEYFPRKARRLRFLPDLPVHELAETRLHELLHAAYSMVCVDELGLGGWQEIVSAEEWFVGAGAIQLTGIMVANPAVREWLAWAWAQPV